MNLLLLNPEVQAYLKKHQNTPLHSFILKGSPFKNITIQELAQQIEGLSKAKNKLPLWYNTENILFPPKVNLEQTSSEATAQYKSSVVNCGVLVDGTGGFGIDAYYFAQKCKEVIHIELNESLSAYAKWNASKLGQDNITFVINDSIAYLKDVNTKLDTIFLDPGRRTDAKGKVFMLKDCLPNVPLYLNFLLSKTHELWIKTAPLLDITAGLEELQKVQEIHVVALKNEVKEILWKVTAAKNSNPILKIINLQSNDPELEFSYQDIFDCVPHYERPQSYLYEPNAALMKSGAFNWVCSRFDVNKLGVNSHLYTSKRLKEFAGRRFKIEKVIPYNKKTVKELLIKKANITTRNFPLKVDVLRKKLKIKDGGETYLFFTTISEKDLTVIVCKKV